TRSTPAARRRWSRPRSAISPGNATWRRRTSCPTRSRRRCPEMEKETAPPLAGPRGFALLSIAAAAATIALKALAWWLTGSVGLLSDALEGTINLAGAIVALVMLTVAARPPDDEHAFGYSKAEYFSSGIEGTLILLAAIAIAAAA